MDTFSAVPKKRKHNLVDSSGAAAAAAQNDDMRIKPRTDLLAKPASPVAKGLFRILKFGGSSQKDPQRLGQVVKLVKAEEQAAGGEGKTLAVVLSAQGDTTDWLIDAMDVARQGRAVAAEAVIDRIADLALSNAIACHHNLGATVSTQPQGVSVDFVRVIREFLAPLRSVVHGVSLVREVTPTTLDYALSFGDRLAALVVSQLLRAQGVESHYEDSREWCTTNSHFGAASADWEPTMSKLSTLSVQWAGRGVVVCAGFVGATADGQTTTLGRNGSDYTATLLGAGLGASEVIVNTDVPGVMTADPGLEPTAFPVKQLSYSEAVELAVLGISMFHPRSLGPLMRTNVPMIIRHTLNPNQHGTRIDQYGCPNINNSAAWRPTCIATMEELALVSVSLNHHLDISPTTIAKGLEKAGVKVQFACFQSRSIQVTVPQTAIQATLDAIESAGGKSVLEQTKVRNPVTMMSTVFEGVNRKPGVVALLSDALAKANVNILQISSNPRSVNCLLDESDVVLAVRRAHTAFNLSVKQKLGLFILCSGDNRGNDVSQEFLQLLQRSQPRLERDIGWSVSVIGVVSQGSDVMMFNGADGVSPDDAIKAIGKAKEGTSDNTRSGSTRRDGCECARGVLRGFGVKSAAEPNGKDKDESEDGPLLSDEVLDQLALSSAPLLFDCSGLTRVSGLYKRCMERGIHIISTTARTVYHLPMSVWQRHDWVDTTEETWVDKSGRDKAFLMCDSSIGGGLPVLATARRLLRETVEVVEVECALSGSLNFICDQVRHGSSLSDAVQKAYELRHTERSVHEDLLGVNLGHKCAVLARQMGVDVRLADMDLKPLVPANLLNTTNNAELFANLRDHDAVWASLHAPDANEHVRMIGVMVFESRDDGVRSVKVKVELQRLDKEHSMFNLKDTEVAVRFISKLGSGPKTPLSLQGAGQGGEDGAAGALSDALAIVHRLNPTKYTQ